MIGEKRHKFGTKRWTQHKTGVELQRVKTAALSAEQAAGVKVPPEPIATHDKKSVGGSLANEADVEEGIAPETAADSSAT